MKISELEDRLENVNSELMTVYETTEAISAAADQGGMKIESLFFAIDGVSKSAYKAAREVESLASEVMKINAKIKEL